MFPRCVLMIASAILLGSAAQAQDAPRVDLQTSAPVVLIDGDDDSDDEAIELTVSANSPARAVRLSGRGIERVRVLGASGVLALPATLPASTSPHRLRVVGSEPSVQADDVVLNAEQLAPDGGVVGSAQVSLTVIRVRVLDAENRPLDAARSSLQVSNAISDDESLPRTDELGANSHDPDNFRIEVVDPSAGARLAEIESVDPRTGVVRDRIAAVALRHGEGGTARSRFLRLVADELDRSAPAVQGQLLRVALRDIVRVRYRGSSYDLRVAGPAGEDRPDAVRQARFDLVVLRLWPGGPPVVGSDDAEATRIARRQVAIANEVYAQCNIHWGEPDEHAVRIVDPPAATLLAVADGDGLPAAGGVVRFRVGGRAIRPLETRPRWTPLDTAVAIAQRIRAVGFRPEVTHNVRTDDGAGESVDVVARGPDGRPLAFESEPSLPLTTDTRQRLQIGTVDLSDRLDDFDNMNASSGTLEERTLIKTLSDGDPTTIDLFIVNRFGSGSRQGEAFIEADAGPILNAVILDRSGIRQERESWTQSHEAGHVLLNQPYHPDNVGPDRPWLLMDADASLGAISGPKRLTDDECNRIVAESGPDGFPPLLRRVEPGAPREAPR